MPMEVGVRTTVQLLVLLLALPVQWWLSGSSTESQRLVEVRGLVASFGRLRAGCWDLLVSARSRLLAALLPRPRGASPSPASDQADDTRAAPATPDQPAAAADEEKGHFAASLEPRTDRPSALLFRVGQVVKHKKWGYRGVIVGWDLESRAPKRWLDQMHPADRPDWRAMPNYAVLVDTRDRLTPQMAYVVQENILVQENTRIFHPLLDHYFETFDGARYVSRPWHRNVYPQD